MFGVIKMGPQVAPLLGRKTMHRAGYLSTAVYTVEEVEGICEAV
jgi:hypothetical protein